IGSTNLLGTATSTTHLRSDPDSSASGHIEAEERLRLVLQFLRRQLLVLELAAELLERRFADDDLIRCCGATKARAGVRRVADDGVAESLRATDVSGNQWSRVDTEADFQACFARCYAARVEILE